MPSTVEEAVVALRAEGAVALAGGTSVGLLIGQGLLEPAMVVWLGRIAELRRLAHRERHLIVGAGVTLRELAAHPEVRANAPALAAAAGAVGNSRIRAVATVGGALAHADPRQDLPASCVAHTAAVEVAGPSGRRPIPVAKLATGFMSTVLAPGEIVTAVVVPVVPGLRSVDPRHAPGTQALPAEWGNRTPLRGSTLCGPHLATRTPRHHQGGSSLRRGQSAQR